MNIPLVKPTIEDDDREAVAKVLEETDGRFWLSQGPRVLELEAAVAAYLGRPPEEVVACSSGTAALHLALEATELPDDCLVACPSFTFIATANAISMSRHRLHFTDCDNEGVMKPEWPEPFTTLLPVHHHGIANKWADSEHAGVIHDACPSFGAGWRGQPLGTGKGTFCFSLHALKPLTCGEGGLLVARREIADRVRLLRCHGMTKSAYARSSEGVIEAVKFEQYVCVGYNYRMPELTAALAISQLAKLDRLIERRREVALAYDQLLEPRVGLFGLDSRSEWAAQSYVVALGTKEQRDAGLARLRERGLEAKRGVMACHREPVYALADHGDLSTTERLADTTLRLPIYAMTPLEAEYAAEVAGEVLCTG